MKAGITTTADHEFRQQMDALRHELEREKKRADAEYVGYAQRCLPLRISWRGVAWPDMRSGTNHDHEYGNQPRETRMYSKTGTTSPKET